MKSKTNEVLVANTVKTTSLALPDASYITVHFMAGTGPIFFTVDGTDPSVNGNDTFVVHAKAPVCVVQIDTASAQTVKSISATADTIAVIAQRR